MYNNERDVEVKANLTIVLSAIATLFLGGMFLFFTWRAIAWEFNLPVFNYWVCVCAVGALSTICKLLGSIFHESK